MADLAELYESTRADIGARVSDLDDDRAGTPVPATPGWTIRDVVAHLVGDVEALTSGDFPAEFFSNFGVPSAVATLNGWTARYLAKRAGVAIPDLLAEWDRLVPGLLRILREEEPLPEGVIPIAPIALVTDLAVHLHDIQGALGIVADRDAFPVKVGFASYVGALQMRMMSADMPALSFEADGKSWTVGMGEPEATVRSTRFELFRALSGRRSPDQIRALDWTGDPEPFVELFFPYGPRSEPLVE